VALAVALIAGIAVIWFTVHRERTVALLASTPTPTTEGDAQAAYNRGLAYYNNKDYNKAISDYTEAIRLKRDYAFYYNDRGKAYNGKKDYDKAISDYTEAIRLDPNNTFYYDNRGDAYQSQGKPDKAKADFAKANQLKKAGQ
jgi:tetratricopeptide (TPR) repeat protein